MFLNEIPSHIFLVFEILLFNFQRPNACLAGSPPRDLLILPHLPAFVNTFFKFSLKKFSTIGFEPAAGASLPRCACIVYHFFPLLSSTFLNFFEKNLRFSSVRNRQEAFSLRQALRF